MAYELKDGQGSLFKNDKEGVETRADYKGSIRIAGHDYWLSAWIKEGKNGKFMSLSAKIKEKPQPLPTRAKDGVDDDVPF